jgi:hypothetical protein
MQMSWSQSVAAPLKGLALARERGGLLAWDEQDGLHLYNEQGAQQARIQAPAPLTAACSADDGNSHAAASAAGGQVWLFAPDLTVRWQRRLSQPVTALALDPLGEYLAVADRGGQLYLIDRLGKPVWQASTPRPLHHLSFVAEKPVVLGCADFGLVVCVDARGELLWRDGLVAHVGSLSVSGDGSQVVLACFSEGVCCYAHDRGTPERLAVDLPCALAAISYAGDLLLTASRNQRVCLRERGGGLRDHFLPDAPVVALALGPANGPVVLGLANGQILSLTPEMGGQFIK